MPICPHCCSQLTGAQFFAMLPWRQKQILKLYGQGLRQKEIAETVNISVKTIGAHRERLMKKLGLHSTHQLREFGAQFNRPDRLGVILGIERRIA